MAKLVRDAMTANPRTLRVGATVLDAARAMEEEDVGSIPVVDADGILFGVITDRDIVLRVVAAGRNPAALALTLSRPGMSALPIRRSPWTRRCSRWRNGRCAGCR